MNRQVHVARDSLFSTSSGWTNYRGFFNLAFLLLVVSNGRVALENLIKYGILISPLQWVDSLATTPLWCWPNLYIVLCLNFSIIAVYILERLLAKDLLINRTAAFYYVVIFGLHLAIPPFVILLSEDGNPLFSFGTLTAVVVVTLKLISYGHVNSFLRAERDSLKNSTEEMKRESVSEEAEVIDAEVRQDGSGKTRAGGRDRMLKENNQKHTHFCQ